MSTLLSCTLTLMVDSAILPGFSLAGFPYPHSGESINHVQPLLVARLSGTLNSQAEIVTSNVVIIHWYFKLRSSLQNYQQSD